MENRLGKWNDAHEIETRPELDGAGRTPTDKIYTLVPLTEHYFYTLNPGLGKSPDHDALLKLAQGLEPAAVVAPVVPESDPIPANEDDGHA